jgi:hypothetical protein
MVMIDAHETEMSVDRKNGPPRAAGPAGGGPSFDHSPLRAIAQELHPERRVPNCHLTCLR